MIAVVIVVLILGLLALVVVSWPFAPKHDPAAGRPVRGEVVERGPLTADERERARGIAVYAMWYEDRSDLGPDREPAFVSCLWLSKEEAELAMMGKRPVADWDGYWIQGPTSLLGVHELNAIGPMTVRRVLRKVERREPGPVGNAYWEE